MHPSTCRIDAGDRPCTLLCDGLRPTLAAVGRNPRSHKLFIGPHNGTVSTVQRIGAHSVPETLNSSERRSHGVLAGVTLPVPAA